MTRRQPGPVMVPLPGSSRPGLPTTTRVHSGATETTRGLAEGAQMGRRSAVEAPSRTRERGGVRGGGTDQSRGWRVRHWLLGRRGLPGSRGSRVVQGAPQETALHQHRGSPSGCKDIHKALAPPRTAGVSFQPQKYKTTQR